MQHPSSPREVGAARRVLMIAFHFPPYAMSSGVQRTLRFVQHLPAHGWQPVVLSAHPRAFVATADDLVKEIPPGTVVERAFALDTARHLSIAGRYPGFLARPDRWRSWVLGAVPAGLRLIRRHRPEAIWSTYPIASAHLIALQLHRLTGLPLVADFRDPMAQEGYPADPRTWQSFHRIEASLARSAARLVFVTPGAQASYRTRFPQRPAEHFVTIENGYDEESFTAAEHGLDAAPLNPGCVTLLHSGIVYPSERDPTALFSALGRMRRDGRVAAASFRLRFRASGHDEMLRRLAAETGTADLVEILPSVPYRQALQEMLRADGLVVMQAANCNEQIPAKLYEYLRSGRPVLGLADPAGDTGRTMRAAGVAQVAALEDSAQVEAALAAFLADGLRPPEGASDPVRLASMSRQSRARELAALLDSVTHVAAAPRN
jgi:glycosyltransferase involved in cell wall biosynthesis